MSLWNNISECCYKANDANTSKDQHLLESKVVPIHSFSVHATILSLNILLIFETENLKSVIAVMATMQKEILEWNGLSLESEHAKHWKLPESMYLQFGIHGCVERIRMYLAPIDIQNL